MPPAASKAPIDYLFAFVVSLIVIGVTFFVKPADTRWIVFAVGVVMALGVVVAALRPSRPTRR
jgi:F0F1-type ATP synthase membrane subunit c/vacuolar-type H+-ATPase subunit K